MNQEIANLQPTAIWANFRTLLNIPRPSKKEERIIAAMKEFGENLGLETIIDGVGNVIIKKPATAGMENRKVVVLQGHLDMVPQKNSDTVHDFEKDPISAYVDGEWVKAKGTTLGADNGMGVAAAMGVLESTDMVHGPIEALFTIDEETGMTGAFGLKEGLLDGDILINMDSEDEGELFIGCAGGENANISFPYTNVSVPAGTVAYKLAVTGLKGGHSGLDIHLGRGNSNKILNRLMWNAQEKFGLRLASIDGGSLRNAIPRESFATVVVPEGNAAAFEAYTKELFATVANELSTTEPDLLINIEKIETPDHLVDEDTQKRLFWAVYACPSGAMRMNADMPELVETSTNLATVKSVDGAIKAQCLMRSSVDSAKQDLADMTLAVFELAGADITFDGTYPGWKPNPDSAILKEMREIYNKKYGKIPDIKVMHAGLECGLLGAVYTNWDMISFGPTIRNPHSPDEKVHIGSVQKFWDFLVDTLANIPVK